MVLARVVMVEVALLGAVVVDVSLVRVIRREVCLALAFSVSFAECVVHAACRDYFNAAVVRSKKTKRETEDGRLTCTRFGGITSMRASSQWIRRGPLQQCGRSPTPRSPVGVHQNTNKKGE